MISDLTIKKNWNYIVLKYGVIKNFNPHGRVNMRDTYSNIPSYWNKIKVRRLYIPIPGSLINLAGFIDLVNEEVHPEKPEHQAFLSSVLEDLKRLEKVMVKSI
jgi:hypothetical protein